MGLIRVWYKVWVGVGARGMVQGVGIMGVVRGVGAKGMVQCVGGCGCKGYRGPTSERPMM